MFKTLLYWFLDWVKGLISDYLKKKAVEKKEEERVDEIVKRAESPELPVAVDATDEMEDEFNRNA